MYIVERFLSYSFVVIFSWGLFSYNKSQDYVYIVTAIYTVLLLVCNAINRKPIKIYHGNAEKICILMVLIWIYGIAVGTIRGNEPQYIFRNFAGMVLFYIIFLIENSSVDLNHIGKFLLTSSFIQAILLPFLFIFKYNLGDFVGHIYSFFSFNLDGSGYLSILYSNVSLIFLNYIYCLNKSFSEGKILSKYFLFALYDIIIILLCSRQGGNEFELLALTVLFFASIVSRNVNRNSFIASMLLILVSCGMLFLLKINPIEIIFSKTDGGNSVRYTEIKYVLEHFNFFGHGLGASYSEIGKNYAIEVQSLDIVYKFGVLGLIVIAIYIDIIAKSVKLLRRKSENWIDCLPLGLMGFFFFSFGNPVLFSATSVFNCVMAIMIIETRNEELCEFC